MEYPNETQMRDITLAPMLRSKDRWARKEAWALWVSSTRARMRKGGVIVRPVVGARECDGERWVAITTEGAAMNLLRSYGGGMCLGNPGLWHGGNDRRGLLRRKKRSSQ